MSGDINKNQPIIADKDLPKVDGVKVLKVLRIIIDRDESFFNCIMEDGTTRPIPIEEFGSNLKFATNEAPETKKSSKKTAKE